MGTTANVVESVDKDKAADALRDMAKRGVKVAFCHGFEYLAAAEEVAKSNDTMKIVVSGADAGKGYDHIYMLDMDISGASYQLGVLAAKLSTSGKVAFLAGANFPSVLAAAKGFEEGAKATRPDVTVTSITDVGWNDAIKAKQQAETVMKAGVDVIYADLDASSKGVFEAIKEHNGGTSDSTKRMVWVMGCNSDQNENPIAGEWTVASCVIRLDKAFADAAKAAKDGTFKPGIHKVDLKSGEAVAVVNPKLKGKVVTEEMVKAMEEKK
jgi:basic membrane protein A